MSMFTAHDECAIEIDSATDKNGTFNSSLFTALFKAHGIPVKCTLLFRGVDGEKVCACF